MVPQTTRPATITRHTAPVRLRLQPNDPNAGNYQIPHLKLRCELNWMVNFQFHIVLCTGIAVQAPINVPRMVNSTQIRAPSGAIIQQHPANVQIQSHPPALHPVSQNTFAPGGAQVCRRFNTFSPDSQTTCDNDLLLSRSKLDSCYERTCCAFCPIYGSNKTGYGKWCTYHTP